MKAPRPLAVLAIIAVIGVLGVATWAATTGSVKHRFPGVPADAVAPDAVAAAEQSTDPTAEAAVEPDAFAACPVLEPAPPAVDGAVYLPGADLARHAGARVEFPQELTVAQNYFLGRYGQLTLSVGGRVFHPNNGTCATPWDAIERFVVIDDGSAAQNPAPVPFMTGATLRTGATVTGLAGRLQLADVYMDSVGIARYWTVVPEDGIAFSGVANPRPVAAPEVGGDVRVAVFNVENWFTTLGSRGARNQAELGRQQAKLVAALAGLDADVIGLIEVENDDGASLNVLLNGRAGMPGLNHQPGGNYSWVMAPGFGSGSDEIALAFIYRPSVLLPVGPTLADTAPLHNRPPLVQAFEHVATGEVFTLALAHFKSRGGCDFSDPDEGQGCWNALRTRQAQAMLTFIEDRLGPVAGGGGGNGESAAAGRILLLGDLNAYPLEAPVQTFTEGGFTDLMAEFVPPAERYTYVFSPGWSGYIDHALASPAMFDLVCGVAPWHINADEPVVLAYSAARFGPDLYAPDEFRSSDHDPIVIGLGVARDC